MARHRHDLEVKEGVMLVCDRDKIEFLLAVSAASCWQILKFF
jgi:hypothetical protein